MPSRKFLSHLGFLAAIRAWLMNHPRAVTRLALGGLLIASLLVLLKITRCFEDDILPGEYEVTLPVFRLFRSYYHLILWGLVPSFALALFRSGKQRPTRAVVLASLLVFAMWAASEFVLSEASAKLLHAGVEPSALNEIFRVVLTGGLILSPPLFLLWFSRWPILDRYVLTQFLLPFLLSFVGFIAVWLIIDLSDNGPDFIEDKAPFGAVFQYYLVQLPFMVVLVAPITLLLAVLYSLGRMSRSNEIISMLGAGKSLLGVLRPLFFFGIYFSLVCLALNYEWAPEAQARKEAIMDALDENEYDKAYVARSQLYRNREQRRLWFVGRVPFDLVGDVLRTVDVYQEDAAGRLVSAYYAKRAKWYHYSGEWRFSYGIQFDFPEQGSPVQTPFDHLYMSGWSETPWKIYSENLDAELMGVPALAFHVKTNSDQPAKKLAPFRTHRQYRWALPWSCLVIVLIAAPLGIVYSRRGVLGGVATCIFLFFSILFLTNLFLALGQGRRIAPFWGAWTTNILFGLIGLGLLWFRARNRELPRFSLATLRARFSR